MNDYRLPEEVLFASDIGRKEKLLFSIIYTEVLSNKGKCDIINKEFAKIIGTDTNQITKSLKKLKDHNYIETKYVNRTPGVKPGVSYVEMFSKKPKYKILRTIYINKKYLKRRRRRTHEAK